MLSEGFTRLFYQIAAGECRLSLIELAARLELGSELGTLGQIEKIRSILDDHNLQMVPDLSKGELDSARALRFKSVAISAHEQFLDDLKNDEKRDLEFKSTLLFDLQRYDKQNPRPHYDECRSEKVLHSTLKTVAAFLNTQGGRLYVGLDDDKQAVGIEHDFRLTSIGNWDNWALFFRQCLETKFRDGHMVNDHVEVDWFEHEKVHISAITVWPRHSLSFVQVEKRYLLYRRQGNRTTEVQITEIEEFLRRRWNLP